MQRRLTFSGHGLRIASDLDLPEFSPLADEGCADVDIFLREGESNEIGQGYRRDAHGFHIWWEDVGKFLVSPGGVIQAIRSPAVADSLLRIPLLGVVLAVALQYHDRFVLHGNAMAIDGQGIILVGGKGQGKSTLSAALLAEGHELISDDVSCVTTTKKGTIVHRGSQQLRLWPDTIAHVFSDASLPDMPLHDKTDKRLVPLPPSLTDRDVPLRGIYLLEKSDRIAIRDLPPTVRWQELMKNSYAGRFGSAFFSDANAAHHFSTCLALSTAVPVRVLSRPHDFSCMKAVLACLKRDLDQTSGNRI